MSVEVGFVTGDFALTPDQHSLPLWRYLSVEGLLLTLGRGLRFTRLRCFDDPYDGRLTEGGTAAYVASWMDRGLADLTTFTPSEWAARAPIELIANCWCLSSDESMAMWDIYGRGTTGTAIISSAERLQAALGMIDDYVSEELNRISYVHIGRVRYAGDSVQSDIALRGQIRTLVDFSLVKRNAFAHEQEVRIVINHPGSEERIVLQWVSPLLRRAEAQERRATILEQLIEEIVVTPRASTDTVDGIRYLVDQVAPGSGRLVRRSDLLDAPPAS